MDSLATLDAVSFDCFGTLLSVDRPDDPAEAVAAALAEEGIGVPEDWAAAYAQPHLDVEPGREHSLVDHVVAALASQYDRQISTAAVRAAVRDAFDVPVRTRGGAVAAVEAASDAGAVGICSNCAVPGLVAEAVDRSAIDSDRFDATVTSVGCGWRKPHPDAFEAIADELGVSPNALVHVGDDDETDGAAPNAILLSDRSLQELADHWRDA